MVNEDRCQDIPYLVRLLYKAICKDFDKRLNECGLTGQQGRILFFISHKTEIDKIEVHQNDIEQEYNLSKSTVSGIVKRLEKKELITITKQHPYAILKPAPKGLELIQHLRESKKKNLARLTNGLFKEDTERLSANLIKLIENMEGEE